MISFLRGNAYNISDVSVCLVNSSGVGFNVYCNKKTLEQLEDSQKVNFFVHTQLSQEDIQLFGFLEERELNFFKILIKVNGVGCKMAQAILELDIDTLAGAIINNDIKCLTKVKGVGSKTAQRIILELKSIVEAKYSGDLSSVSENVEDARYALIALGYNPKTIDSTLLEIDGKLSSSEIIKEFLKRISGNC